MHVRCYLISSTPPIFLLFEILHVLNTIASGVLHIVSYILASQSGLTHFGMAPPTNDAMVKAFINLISHTWEHTPNLPCCLFPIINEADIERISLGEVTLIPLLFTRLASLHDLRTEVSILRTGLDALDTHTRVLSTISELQEVVSDKVTAPLLSMLHDL